MKAIIVLLLILLFNLVNAQENIEPPLKGEYFGQNFYWIDAKIIGEN